MLSHAHAHPSRSLSCSPLHYRLALISYVGGDTLYYHGHTLPLTCSLPPCLSHSCSDSHWLLLLGPPHRCCRPPTPPCNAFQCVLSIFSSLLPESSATDAIPLVDPRRPAFLVANLRGLRHRACAQLTWILFSFPYYWSVIPV